MKTPEEIKKGLEYLSCTNVAEKVERAKQGLPYAYAEDIAADALALIHQLEAKLAEYEKPLEPLTLEEVKTIRGVWIEDDGCCWGSEEPQPALWDGRVNGRFHQFIDKDYSYEEEHVYFEEAEYGRTWRCWSRRPTDEERKAAKWDG